MALVTIYNTAHEMVCGFSEQTMEAARETLADIGFQQNAECEFTDNAGLYATVHMTGKR